MNNNLSLKKFEVINTLLIIAIGALLHFTFKWSNNNAFVGIFSAVNESVWEHLKILYVPMLLSTITGYFYFKDIPNYLCSKTKGILLSIMFIIIFFYTYTGIIGKHFPIIDISSFVASIIIGQIYSYKNIIKNKNCNNKVSLYTLILLSIAFIIFTFNPPKLNLFKDPINKTYGIKNTQQKH